MARAPQHPQHGILAVQTRRQELEPSPTVQHIFITVEKTYTSVELRVVPPLEVTLKAMQYTLPPQTAPITVSRNGHRISRIHATRRHTPFATIHKIRQNER